MTTEETETNLLQQDVDGTCEEGRHSPKWTKKMKMEKISDTQSERMHNNTWQTAYKAGKT
jgi:hypothetical protein